MKPTARRSGWTRILRGGIITLCTQTHTHTSWLNSHLSRAPRLASCPVYPCDSWKLSVALWLAKSHRASPLKNHTSPMNVTISLQQSRPSRCTMFPTWHDVTTFTNLRLSVVRMMNRMWIEALELFWRKQNNSLVARDLCIEVLLLVVVARSHIACTPVSMHHCTAHNWQASPSVNDPATSFQPLRISLTDVQNDKGSQPPPSSTSP